MVKDMGKFIQEMRKAKGLTQKELAEEIGISDKTISKWENGNGSPDTSMLIPLCKSLDITVNELLSCEKIPSESYSMKAEETIMTLMEENERTQKGNKISKIIGVVVTLLALWFLAISSAGIRFNILNFIDTPSIIIIVVLAGGIVLVSGARDKRRILSVLSKTIVPIGAVTTMLSIGIVLMNVSSADILAPNLMVASLCLFYSFIIKIVVEVLIEKA